MDRPKLGRWELYKAAQEQVVRWLVQTAGGAVPGAVTLHARQLLDLAKAAVSTAAAVPLAIITLLQDVIDGRKSQAEWHSRRSSGRDNETHQWFIELLIKIRDTLLPFVRDGQLPTAKERDSNVKSVKDHLANVFSLLAVEEPSHSPLGGAPAKPPTQLEDDFMGSEFALWCNIKDLNDVREFIREAWLQYTAGELSIVVVSQLSQVGIGLMRLEDTKFVAKYPQYEGYWKLLTHFGLEVHGAGKTVCVTPLKTTSDDGGRNEELVKLLCPAAAVLLRDTRDEMFRLAQTTEGQTMIRNRGYRIDQVPLMRILELEAYDFSSVLMVQIPELLTWVHDHEVKAERSTTQIFERIEFLYGMAEYYHSKVTPLWLVMACAIHLDVYEIIGDKPAVASKAWLDTTRKMKQHLDETCDYFAGLDHPCEKWKTEFGPIFRELEASENQLYVTEKGLEYQRSRGYQYTSEMLGKASSCIMGTPFVAGAALWGNRVAYHKLGLHVAGFEMTLCALATLYTAMTKSNLIERSWEDMHFLISTHKANTPLVPSSTGPHNASAFFREYLRTLGLSNLQIAKHMTAGVPKHESINPTRAIAPTSEYVVALTKSYHTNDLLDTFDRGDLVETVLTELTARSKGSKQGKKTAKYQPQFAIKEVLSTCKKHMVTDEVHINFDYPAFYMLAEKIRRGLHDLFSEEAKSHELGIALWEIVLHILRDAAKSAEPTMLSAAAAIVGDIIYAPGVKNKFSKQARSASSGGIPRDLAPNIKPYRPVWTAELWEYFARHHHGIRDIRMKPSTFGASHITFYDPKGRKEDFERIAAAAKRFWHMWWANKLKLGVGDRELSVVNVLPHDGRELSLPLPASMKSLGLRGFEGVGIPLLKRIDFPMETVANEAMD